ncbi:MAG: hypothetical protein LBJ26_09900 [Paenibacillus sp.]|jgi:hypothetical protein|nr:hypothetical protein [Paenibacillus sp.]MDR0268402.1 hypothetical protein [Paenibacillus sp.]
MKIRIKVKHLAYTLGLLAILLFGGYCSGLFDQSPAAAETKEQLLRSPRAHPISFEYNVRFDNTQFLQ